MSDPLEFSGRSDPACRDMTQLLHSTHNAKVSCPSSSHPHNLRFQDSCSNRGSVTQKPSDYNENESTQLESTSSSSLSDSQQKDPHTVTGSESDWTWNNDEALSAVLLSAAPRFLFPHCGSEVTAPSKYGYSKSFSFHSISLMQYSDIHKSQISQNEIYILSLANLVGF